MNRNKICSRTPHQHGFFFLGTFLLHNKENTSLLLGWCSHHEVAVADTADELLEEIPRLVGLTKKIEKKGRENSTSSPTQMVLVWGKTAGEAPESEPPPNWSKRAITSSSLNLPALQIRSKSSPPAAYSMTMARCVGVSTT
jgi:hypothetical protein